MILWPLGQHSNTESFNLQQGTENRYYLSFASLNAVTNFGIRIKYDSRTLYRFEVLLKIFGSPNGHDDPYEPNVLQLFRH